MQNTKISRIIDSFSPKSLMLLVVLASWLPTAVIQGADCGCGEMICDCGSCCGCQQDCNRFYYGVRAGAIFQDRDPFRYGRQADDSNDTAALGIETPLDINVGAPAFDFFIGREINACWSAEARFGFAVFDDQDSFTFSGSGNDDAQNSFWITRIDGVQAGPPGAAQGITGGIRFAQEANGTLDYDSEWYDFGIDFVRHARGTCNTTVDYVVGPAIAHIGQDFQQDVIGQFDPSQGRESHVTENLDEWFYGAKIGRSSSHQLNCRLRFVVDMNAYFYYHHADFDGTQIIGGNGGAVSTLSNYVASDRRDNFVPRLELRTGFNYQARKHLTLGVLYQLGAWFNVATIDNPDITLVSQEWLPDHAAQIANEDILTHSVMATVAWWR